MALSIGTQLGSHEITGLLGKGGMGEVYRARDLKLKRDVAIKMSPPEFSQDVERVRRLEREAEVLASLNHTFMEMQGQCSQDVKWIAFQSNESGRFEIYVQAFPRAGKKIQVSVDGGTQVRWRGDGKALFYIGLDEELREVPLHFNTSGNIEPAPPVSLFKSRIGIRTEQGSIQQYAVSADGNRFLMNVVTREQAVSPITVILHK
jgi:hypothetical protein